MLEISTLEKYDAQKMFKVYDEWPKIAQEAYKIELEPVAFQDIEHVVFAGMGGSGAVGDLFSAILSKTNIHVNIVKGYLLPKTVNENTLVIITSISGNTEESLNVLKLAQKEKCKIISFSSGGTLESLCKKNNINYRKIEQIHSPRASFVKYVYSILKTLGLVLPIKENEILESISKLEELSEKISSSNLNESNPSLSLANWIKGIPLIYYPQGFQAAAVRFKNSLQETSKYHAMTENVIETCHNGIVSWERSSDVQPILLTGKDDYIKTKERWEILKDYFNSYNIDYKEISSVDGNILSKLVTLIYQLDYVSLYKAVIEGVDPSPIKSIDFVKNRL